MSPSHALLEMEDETCCPFSDRRHSLWFPVKRRRERRRILSDTSGHRGDRWQLVMELRVQLVGSSLFTPAAGQCSCYVRGATPVAAAVSRETSRHAHRYVTPSSATATLPRG